MARSYSEIWLSRLGGVVRGFFTLLGVRQWPGRSGRTKREGLPDLSSAAGQAFYRDVIADADFVVVDNLSTICRSLKENDADGWAPVQSWALSVAPESPSALFIHTAAKNIGKMGTKTGRPRGRPKGAKNKSQIRTRLPAVGRQGSDRRAARTIPEFGPRLDAGRVGA
jgi:hypothetical protein